MAVFNRQNMFSRPIPRGGQAAERLSVYDQAKLNGFKGTEDEFYERLSRIIGTTENANLTAYQSASIAGYVGTSEQFYQEMAERMMGNDPSTDHSTGIKVRNGNISTTLGDGSRVVLIA